MSSLALRFPFLQLEALNVDIERESAIVVSARNTVTAATPVCLQKGVELGMPANSANMILSCRSIERNVEKEAALVTRICDELYAFTPYIERYCPNVKDPCIDQGLLLELSRCIRLFKGLDALVTQIHAALTKLNVRFHSAVGHSGRAAWLLSYLEHGVGLDGVDIYLLHEYPKQARSLALAGFRNLQDLRLHTEKEGFFSLQKRFNPEFIDYLKSVLPEHHNQDSAACHDQQLGLFTAPNRHKPFTVYQPEQPFSEVMEFDFPVTSIELLYEPMKTLLQALSSYLVSTQQQCAGITWCFSDIYHNKEYLEVKSERIYRDWKLLFELSQIKLESFGLPFEIDQIELRHPILAPAHFDPPNLDESLQTGHVTNKSTQLVIAKIQARVGDNNVFKVSSNNSHIPEFSQKKVAANAKASKDLLGEHRYAERPPWLLNEPVLIGQQQNNLYWHGRIQIVRGPEKLMAQWWGEPLEREYFLAVREDHVRLWVFNDLHKQEWRVQGVF